MAQAVAERAAVRGESVKLNVSLILPLFETMLSESPRFGSRVGNKGTQPVLQE